MGTYVKNGNSCIGCNLLEEFPGECNGCNNLKDQVELIEVSADLKEALKLSQEYYHNSLEEIKKLKKQLSQLESHMGLPDLKLKGGE